MPGTSSFLVLVHNTGNTEDSYTATIAGVSGPVLASLQGLDGSATQTIPLFRLPGLSSGAILLNATVTAGNDPGSITVRVQSTTNAAMTALVTASASAQMPVNPNSNTNVAATTIALASSPNPAKASQIITLTATVAATSGNVAPTGTVTFFIDGTAQSAVGLIVTNGQAQATFSTSTLTPGVRTRSRPLTMEAICSPPASRIE